MGEGNLQEFEGTANQHGIALIGDYFTKRNIPASEFAVKRLILTFQKAMSTLPSNEVEIERQRLLEIAINGSLNGEQINGFAPGGGPASDFIDQRSKLIAIYSRNPELAEAIVHYDIVGIHGATSGTLPGVVEDGLIPLSQLDEKEKLVVAGEQIFANDAMQKLTSFVHWNEISEIKNYFGNSTPITAQFLENYIAEVEKSLPEMIKRDKIKERGHFVQNFRRAIERHKKLLAFLRTPAKNEDDSLLQDLIMQNFPVVYGINLQGIDREKITKPRSGIRTEFVVEDGVPVENIKIILVPESKIGFVRQIIKGKGQTIEVHLVESILEE